MTSHPFVRRKAYQVAWYEELTHRLHHVGASVPVFLEQVGAFLTATAARNSEEQIALDHVRALCLELRSAATVKAGPTLAESQPVWVPGHSPVSGGVRQFERQIEVLTAVPIPPRAIALHFRVPSYMRRGHYFDMESLGYVLLAAWRHNLAYTAPVKLEDPFQPESIWVTMSATADREIGVEIAHEVPPEPPPEAVSVDQVIARPPTMSVRGATIPEVDGQSELSGHPWLGLDLTFGPEVDVAEFGFEGPIKPLIDALGPVLGRDGRGGPADHRIHDLRIRTEGPGDGTIRVRFWYCDA